MMKTKRILLITIIAMSVAALCSINVFAKTIDSKTMGITFDISDDWTDFSAGEDVYYFKNDESNERWETIEISAADIGAYYLDEFTESELLEFCSDFYSNQALADSLSQSNGGAYIRVNTDSQLSKYETYNNIQYYRYEKSYTASAYGYNPTAFYLTAFLTARNGKLYVIEYSRDYELNHFSDVVKLLDSISFDNGEIKIYINGNRIYPDSVPIIVEDRTLVPIRAIAEEMGYNVGWNGDEMLVTLEAQGGYPVLHYNIFSYTAMKNYEKFELDVPPIIYRDRTYMPLRSATEAMGADVKWDGTLKRIDITY